MDRNPSGDNDMLINSPKLYHDKIPTCTEIEIVKCIACHLFCILKNINSAESRIHLQEVEGGWAESVEATYDVKAVSLYSPSIICVLHTVSKAKEILLCPVSCVLKSGQLQKSIPHDNIIDNNLLSVIV